MPRIRNRRALGSVSFLFLAAIVPLLMVFVCLGAELTHFFGAHDDLQRVVDHQPGEPAVGAHRVDHIGPRRSGLEHQRHLAGEAARRHQIGSQFTTDGEVSRP